MSTVNRAEFMEWDWEMISHWICTLEQGRFKKYEAVLRMALSESDMTGDQLVHINQLVIKMWGIKDNKDCMSLIGHIRGLVDQNAGLGLAQEAVKEKEGAITEFVSHCPTECCATENNSTSTLRDAARPIIWTQADHFKLKRPVDRSKAEIDKKH